jgi:hypothetical protein
MAHSFLFSATRSLCFAGFLCLVATEARADAPIRPMAARAKEHVANVATWGLSVQSMLRAARAQSDSDRSACLGDLLTRIHVAGRNARALHDAIVAAGAMGDERAAVRESVRLDHLSERTKRLAADAQRCGGGPVIAAHRTVVRSLVPPLPPEPDQRPAPRRAP